MDFNQKSRGQKHHKNKALYKSKHKNKIKHTEAPRENRKLVQNVNPSRSSSDSSDEEVVNESITWNDFSLLANAPVSVGGHFQFKSDKNAETSLENLQDDLFSLDLNILQYSLNSISFFERCGLDSSYFTESELEKMKTKAQSNKVQYDNYLSFMVRNKKAGADVLDGNLSEETSEETDTSKDVLHTSDQANSSHTENKQIVNVDKSELEGWLDDILGS
ncbi:hypothetical protein FQR65_LT04895 [Abscondita terminalis]|nr:hypothetical protein FQR65_LT04895 [Abscondita terminalis]